MDIANRTKKTCIKLLIIWFGKEEIDQSVLRDLLRNLDNQQKLQNKIVREITDSGRYMKITNLHKKADIQLITDYTKHRRNHTFNAQTLASKSCHIE